MSNNPDQEPVPSLKGWHFTAKYKCPRCGKSGVLWKDVHELSKQEFWCPKEFDNNGCGWKSDYPFDDPESLTSQVAELKHLVVELAQDVDWILAFLRSTTNPDESELVTGYFKRRGKRTPIT